MQLEKLKLADKPSAALRQALADLEFIEKDERYQIEMWTWHEPHKRYVNKCCVCLAGAMLARSGVLGPDEKFESVFGFDDVLSKKLYAINSFRMGEIYDGLKYWGLESVLRENTTPDAVVEDYDADPEQFKYDLMNNVIHVLEEMGV